MFQHSNKTHTDTSDGLSDATGARVITTASEVHLAEVGTTHSPEHNPRGSDLFASYCFIVRLLEMSIVDYKQSKNEQIRTSEIYFWRESNTFLHYGKLVCELESLLFGRELSLDDLRRGAERMMGIPVNTLAPHIPRTPEETEAVSCHLDNRFSFIRQTVGHVADPKADKMFHPAGTASKKPATVPLFATA